VAAKRIEEQLERARGNCEALRSKYEEYDELEKLLEDLPGKVQHQIMVPLGPLAFFEGYLEHTGEVLTQLSSEWFALRTVKHALGMVERRRARIHADQEIANREVHELEQRRRVAIRAKRASAGPDELAMDLVARANVDCDVPGSSVQVDEDGFLDIREPYVEAADGVGAQQIGADGPAADKIAVHSTPSLAAPSTISAAAEIPGELPPELPSAVSDQASCESGGKAMADALQQLREFERLEELESLDELMESCERGDVGDTDTSGQDVAVAAAAASVDAEEVRSPADLFRVMNRVDEASAVGAERRTPAGAPADAGAARPFGTTFAPQPRARDSQVPRASPLFGASTEEGTAFSGRVNERLASAPAAFTGAAPVRTSKQTPEAPVSRGTRECVGNYFGDGCGAADASVAPQRVSKFKADRQRARG